MIRTKILKDRYSLYIKIGTEVYRPVQTDQTKELFGHILPDIVLTRFREGNTVLCKKLSNGIATLKSENFKVKEKWFYNGSGISSKQWRPYTGFGS